MVCWERKDNYSIFKDVKLDKGVKLYKETNGLKLNQKKNIRVNIDALSKLNF